MTHAQSDLQADLFREFGIELGAESSENSREKPNEKSEKSRANSAKNPHEKKSEKPEIAQNFAPEKPEKSPEIIPEFSVTEARALMNQVFETAMPSVRIVGEVANFKVNQGKWVFFDLKDSESSLGCFMSAWQLRVALENGMRVAVVAAPNITKWGKFSLTIRSVRPVGAGSIKRAFDLLREKLQKEGLFDENRKRALPRFPAKIGVVSSADAAGFRDFVKIVGARMRGVEIVLAHTQVQGGSAAAQIVGALKYLNASTDVDAIAILRGGGSRDDLVAFDDEKVVREIAASRVPTITGVGHEIDTTLADLAADVRASTPSNAAEILVPDRREILANIEREIYAVHDLTEARIEQKMCSTRENLAEILKAIGAKSDENSSRFSALKFALSARNPTEILRRGYAILRDADGRVLTRKPKIGEKIVADTAEFLIESEVKNVAKK